MGYGGGDSVRTSWQLTTSCSDKVLSPASVWTVAIICVEVGACWYGASSFKPMLLPFRYDIADRHGSDSSSDCRIWPSIIGRCLPKIRTCNSWPTLLALYIIVCFIFVFSFFVELSLLCGWRTYLENSTTGTLQRSRGCQGAQETRCRGGDHSCTSHP